MEFIELVATVVVSGLIGLIVGVSIGNNLD